MIQRQLLLSTLALCLAACLALSFVSSGAAQLAYVPAKSTVVCACAKCGSTSLFHWLYSSLRGGREFDSSGGKWIQNLWDKQWKGRDASEVAVRPGWWPRSTRRARRVHRLKAAQRETVADEMERRVFNSSEPRLEGEDAFDGFSFALVRDPKERLVSSFKSKAACPFYNFTTDYYDRIRLVPVLARLSGVKPTVEKDCYTIAEFVRAIHTVVTVDPPQRKRRGRRGPQSSDDGASASDSASDGSERPPDNPYPMTEGGRVDTGDEEDAEPRKHRRLLLDSHFLAQRDMCFKAHSPSDYDVVSPMPPGKEAMARLARHLSKKKGGVSEEALPFPETHASDKGGRVASCPESIFDWLAPGLARADYERMLDEATVDDYRVFGHWLGPSECARPA